MADKKMKFSVENISPLENSELDKSQFALLKVDAFATGVSAHNTFITEETLRRTASSIIYKPFVFDIDERLDDISTHTKTEIAGGFVPKDSPLEFRKLDDSRIMFSCHVLIWKRYSSDLLRYFERDGNKKSVSVEISIYEEEDKNGLTEIKDFVFNAITGLGEMINPAIPNAQAILQFSQEFEQAKDEFLSDSKSKEKEKVTNKSKNFSLNSSQILEILNNAVSQYKYGEDDMYRKYWVESFDEVCAYLCDYEDGKLYCANYLLDRESKTAIIDIENMHPVIRGGYEKTEKEGEEILPMAEKNKEEPKEDDVKDEKKEEFSLASYVDVGATLKFLEEETEDAKEEDEEEIDDDEEMSMSNQIKMGADELKKEKDMNHGIVMSAMFAKLRKMSAKLKKLSKDAKAYMAENEELKKEKMAQEEKEKEFAVDNFLLELSEKVEIPEEKHTEMKNKSKDILFADLDGWKNECKVMAFDFTKKITNDSDDDDIKRMNHAGLKPSKKQTNSAWNKNKIKK